MHRRAEHGDRQRSVIELLVLQALAHRARGDLPAALAPLEGAVKLAAPEGLRPDLRREGQPMAALPATAAKRGVAPHDVRPLLAAFGGPQITTRAGCGLIDPLSQRELDVLRLLATDLSGPDIARELVVSLNTVPTHNPERLRQGRREQPSRCGATSRRAWPLSRVGGR